MAEIVINPKMIDALNDKVIVTTENITFSNSTFGVVPSKSGYTFVMAYPNTAGYTFSGYYNNGSGLYITAPGAINAAVPAKVIWLKNN